jgi:hypothetical protein
MRLLNINRELRLALQENKAKIKSREMCVIYGGKFRQQTKGVNKQQQGNDKKRDILRYLFIPSRLSSAASNDFDRRYTL